MIIYAGITVGPIFDTINLATKPAALWFASSIFSDFTRRACKAIKQGFENENVKIHSPYYDDNYAYTSKDGVGKFHDRIIFSVESKDKDTVKQSLTSILDKVKEETAKSALPESMSDQGDFFVNYIRTPFILFDSNEFTGDNINLFISPFLDDLELMQNAGKSDSGYSPLYKMLTNYTDYDSKKDTDGKRENTNASIRKSKLFQAIRGDKNQFKKNQDSFWSLEEIASAKHTLINDLKRTKYFAVITADGDGMGSFLKTLQNNDQLIEFSKACINYDTEAAEIIGRHKAITIYAGGDDLLILAPVADQDEYSSNVLTLCDEIREAFKYHMQRFQEENQLEAKKLPTLSFGISIQYYKFPLYQAVADARTLLDAIKHEDGGRKDAAAIHIRKHSGQCFGVILDESIQKDFEDFLRMRVSAKDIQGDADASRGKRESVGSDERLLTSVIKTLTLHSEIIEIADEEYVEDEKKDQYLQVWNNLFDNINQQKFRSYLNGICEWYWAHIAKDRKYLKSQGDPQNNPQIRKIVIDKNTGFSTKYERINVFLDMLRISKFLIEKESGR